MGSTKNVKFTVDRFENVTPHFLDLEICPNGLTHTGQYINMDFFTLWKLKTTWIRSLADLAKKVYLKKTFQKNSN